MGLSPSSDHLNMKTEGLIDKSTGTHKNMDNVLQEALNMDQLFDRLVQLCEKAKKDNIKFSRSKLVIGTEVLYGGHLVRYDKVGKGAFKYYVSKLGVGGCPF